MKRWAVYCAGNSTYMISPNKEPLRMLLSFRNQFGDDLDYIYFTDINEPDLPLVREVCSHHNIKLVLGDCRQYYESYKDVEYLEKRLPPRWPDAHYWYAEAPRCLIGEYDYLIKCDGDMLCNKRFDLTQLEVANEITVAKEPRWYIPYDKFCPNAGFQIINVSAYVENNVHELFRWGSQLPDRFNSDTPLLNYLVASNTLKVHFLTSEFNYLLFDDVRVNKLTLADVQNVNIFHFVGSKPHNLHPHMMDGVKGHFSKTYLNCEL